MSRKPTKQSTSKIGHRPEQISDIGEISTGVRLMGQRECKYSASLEDSGSTEGGKDHFELFPCTYQTWRTIRGMFLSPGILLGYSFTTFAMSWSCLDEFCAMGKYHVCYFVLYDAVFIEKTKHTAAGMSQTGIGFKGNCLIVHMSEGTTRAHRE